jgi:hypothetical protein
MNLLRGAPDPQHLQGCAKGWEVGFSSMRQVIHLGILQFDLALLMLSASNTAGKVYYHVVNGRITSGDSE